jgi:hypothetical protein
MQIPTADTNDAGDVDQMSKTGFSARAVAAISIAACLGLVLLPAAASAQGMPAPSWNVGDWWKYETYSTQFMWGSADSRYFCNQTSYYNITGEESIDINGTSYDCFVVRNTMVGSSQTYSSASESYINFTIDYLFYITRNNMSTAQYIYYYNSTIDSYYSGGGGHHVTLVWQYTVGTYYPPFDGMQYPVEVNETWNVSSTVHSVGYSTSQTDGGTPYTTHFDTWSPTSAQYRCDAAESVSVPAGSFDCHRLNQSSATGTSVTESFSYYSYDAGNSVRTWTQTWGSSGSASYVSNYTQELAGYSYTPVPIPEPGVLPLYAAMIAATAVATYVSHRRLHGR